MPLHDQCSHVALQCLQLNFQHLHFFFTVVQQLIPILHDLIDEESLLLQCLLALARRIDAIFADWWFIFRDFWPSAILVRRKHFLHRLLLRVEDDYGGVPRIAESEGNFLSALVQAKDAIALSPQSLMARQTINLCLNEVLDHWEVAILSFNNI